MILHLCVGSLPTLFPLLCFSFSLCTRVKEKERELLNVKVLRCFVSYFVQLLLCVFLLLSSILCNTRMKFNCVLSRVSKPWHGTATTTLPSLLPFPLHFSTLPFCLQARQPHVSSAHRETEGTGCMFNALLWNPPLHLCLFMVNSVTLWLYYKCHSLLILWSSSVFLSTRKERQIYQIIPLCLLWSYTPL